MRPLFVKLALIFTDQKVFKEVAKKLQRYIFEGILSRFGVSITPCEGQSLEKLTEDTSKCIERCLQSAHGRAPEDRGLSVDLDTLKGKSLPFEKCGSYEL